MSFFHKVDHPATKPVHLSVPFQSCSPSSVSSHLHLSSPVIPVWISDLLQALYLVINIGKLFLDFFLIITMYCYHLITLFIFQGIYLKNFNNVSVSYSLTSEFLFCSPWKVSPHQLLVC